MSQITRAIVCAALLLFVGGCGDGRAPVAQGYVEGEYVYAASPYGGRLEGLFVRRGQNVSEGVPLFRLDSAEERAELESAAQILAGAEARLADLRLGKRPEEMDVLRAQLSQAKEAEVLAARNRKRDDAQLKAGGIAQAQADQSRSAHKTAVARVLELSAQVAAGELPARADQIREQVAEVEAARANLERAHWRLAQKELAAPEQSRVVDTLYREGEWVPSGYPVVKLLPPEQIKIRFFVSEAILSRIATGQTVTVRLNGGADGFPCTVSYLGDKAEYTPPVIYSNETRDKLVFLVEALPAPKEAASLHPGQPVEVVLP